MFKKLLQLWARRRSYKQAVALANQLRAKDFRKYHVVFMQGEFKVFSKHKLKWLYNNGYFKAGVKFRDIEKMVVFTTK